MFKTSSKHDHGPITSWPNVGWDSIQPRSFLRKPVQTSVAINRICKSHKKWLAYFILIQPLCRLWIPVLYSKLQLSVLSNTRISIPQKYWVRHQKARHINPHALRFRFLHPLVWTNSHTSHLINLIHLLALQALNFSGFLSHRNTAAIVLPASRLLASFAASVSFQATCSSSVSSPQRSFSHLAWLSFQYLNVVCFVCHRRTIWICIEKSLKKTWENDGKCPLQQIHHKNSGNWVVCCNQIYSDVNLPILKLCGTTAFHLTEGRSSTQFWPQKSSSFQCPQN